jgi:plastocyanin
MFRKNRLVIPVALALLALAVVAGIGCSSKSSPTQPGSGGGGGGVETFTSGNFNTGSLTTSFVHEFDTAGDYIYYCSIHGSPTGGMRNSVHVATGGADSVIVFIVDDQFNTQPANTATPANVNPGGYVRWITHTATTHNVTR